MTTIALPTSFAPSRSFADAALRAAARFWFVVAVAGQWMFAYYVAVAYGVRRSADIWKDGTSMGRNAMCRAT